MYHAKIMNALGLLLRGHPELMRHVQQLKRSWQRLDPSSSVALGFESQTGLAGGSLGKSVTDVALAYAWLYGDLVHADDVADRAAGHDIDARYHGAVLLITAVALHAIATLNLIRTINEQALLSIDEAVFTVRISPRTDDEITLSGVAMGPVGTPREELEAMLDSPRSGGDS